MTDNENVKEIPFEERTADYKKTIKDFFSRYENNGCEDRIEVCLIRDGYRTVLKAEEQINRQKAEIERLQKHIQEGIDLAKRIPEMVAIAQAEAIKEFSEMLKGHANGEFIFITKKLLDNLVKEMVGDVG